MVTAEPLAIPAPPGYGRAHARETVVFKDRGVLVTGKRAWWRPMYPGTGDAYPGPLFATKDSETPMTFPAQTERDGIIEVWAPEPVRLELSVWADYYPGQSVIVTLLFTEDTEGVVLLEDHLADPDAHPYYATDADLDAHKASADDHPLYATDQDLAEHVAAADAHPGYAQDGDAYTKAESDGKYVDAAGDSMTGPLVVEGNAVKLDANPANVITWGLSGLMSTGAVIDAYTKSESDAKFAVVVHTHGEYAPTAHTHDEYATDADLAAATARIATLESSVTALQAAVAALQTQMTAHIHRAGDWDYLAGTADPDGVVP